MVAHVLPRSSSVDLAARPAARLDLTRLQPHQLSDCTVQTLAHYLQDVDSQLAAASMRFMKAGRLAQRSWSAWVNQLHDPHSARHHCARYDLLNRVSRDARGQMERLKQWDTEIRWRLQRQVARSAPRVGLATARPERYAALVTHNVARSVAR